MSFEYDAERALEDVQHRPHQLDAEPCESRMWACECGFTPSAPDDLGGTFARRRWTLDAVQAHAIAEAVAPSELHAGRRLADAIDDLDGIPYAPSRRLDVRTRELDALETLRASFAALRRSQDGLRAAVADHQTMCDLVERRLADLLRIVGGNAS